jgi:hypothetical protein
VRALAQMLAQIFFAPRVLGQMLAGRST